MVAGGGFGCGRRGLVPDGADRLRAAGSVADGAAWLGAVGSVADGGLGWGAAGLVAGGGRGVTKSGYRDITSLPFLSTRKWTLEFGLFSIGESLADVNARFPYQRILGAGTGCRRSPRILPMQAAGEKLTPSMKKTMVNYKFIQLQSEAESVFQMRRAEKPSYGVTEMDNPIEALALSNFDDQTQIFAVEKGLSADQDSGR